MAKHKDSGSRKWQEWWRERGERELQCILMTAWDPINVSDAPEAWGEYDCYAPHVARILRETEDPQEAAAQVAEFLSGVERDSMEIRANRMHLARLATSLVAWHEWSYTRDGSPPGDDA